MVNEDDAIFIKSSLKAHGYKSSDNGNSESDSGKSESDDELRAMKPPPIPFDDFKHRIVKVSDLNENSNQLNSTIFHDDSNDEVIDECIVCKQNNNGGNQSNDNLINLQTSQPCDNRTSINQSVKVNLAISNRGDIREEVSRLNVESNNDRATTSPLTKINLEIPKKKKKKKKVRQYNVYDQGNVWQSNRTLNNNGAPMNLLGIPNPDIIKQNAFKNAFKIVDNDNPTQVNPLTQLRQTTPNVAVRNLGASGTVPNNRQSLMKPSTESNIAMPKQDFSKNVRELNLAPTNDQAYNTNYYYNTNIPIFYDKSLPERYGLNRQSTPAQRRNEASVLQGLNKQKQNAPQTAPANDLEVAIRNTVLSFNSSTFEKKKEETLMDPLIKSKSTMPKQPDFNENIRQLNVSPINNQAFTTSFTRPNPSVLKEDSRLKVHQFNLSPHKSRTPMKPLTEPNILHSRSESNLSYYNPNVPIFSIRSHDLNGQSTPVQRRNEASVLQELNKQKQNAPQTAPANDLEVPIRNTVLSVNSSTLEKKKKETLMSLLMKLKITMPKQPDFSENVRELNIAPIQNRASTSSFTRPNPSVPKEDSRLKVHQFNLPPHKSRTPMKPLTEPNILHRRSESNLSYYNPHGLNKQTQIVPETTIPYELLRDETSTFVQVEALNRNIDLNANFSRFQNKQSKLKKMKKSPCVIM